MGEFDDIQVIDPPSEAEIARTRRHAVSLGGAALNLPHNPRSTVFQIKTRRGSSPQRIQLVSCGEMAQFTVPLEEQSWQRLVGRKQHEGRRDALTDWQKSANGVRICAVDDAAHLWPRFQ